MDIDDTLAHVYMVLEFADSVQEKLCNEGISDYSNLVRAKSDLEHGRLNVKPYAQRALVEVIRWEESFKNKYGREPAIREELTEEVLTEFNNSADEEQEVSVRAGDLFELCKTYPHSDKATRILNTLLARPDKKKTLANLLGKEAEKVIENMNAKLKEASQFFDAGSFARKIVAAAVLAESNVEGTRKPFYVTGRTQSGKSSVIGIVQTMCSQMNLPLVVITKGDSESADLRRKLERFAAGSPTENYVVCVSSKAGGSGKEKKYAIEAAIGEGGTVVTADTHYQIGKIIEAIKNKKRTFVKKRKFVLVVDECDAMERTVDGTQKFEMAYDELKGMNPSLLVKVSATLAPNLLYEDDIHMFQIETSPNYVGVEDFCPLKIDDADLYLDANELSHSDGYLLNNHCFIPKTNERVIQLYDDALSGGADRRGVLVLDCTTPRVTAEGNLIQKAERVQALYSARGTNIVVVVYVGRGISVRYPDCKSLEWLDKTVKIGEAIEQIDNDSGLDMPVFVFGFSMMRRGISFRSNNRVPTHLVIALGMAHNAMNTVQAHGRGTYNGRDVLNRNGFENVTVLLQNNDLLMTLAHTQFNEKTAQRLKDGKETMVDVMTGRKQKLSDAANFARHTSRKLGQRKGDREKFQERTRNAFHEPVGLAPGEEHKKTKYWNNPVAQRIMRVLWDLSQASGESSQLADIQEAFNDTFLKVHHRITHKVLKPLLAALVRDSIVSKAPKSTRGEFAGRDGKRAAGELDSWVVSSPKALELLINEDHAYISGEIDVFEDSGDSDSDCDLLPNLTMHTVSSVEESDCDSPLPVRGKVIQVSILRYKLY